MDIQTVKQIYRKRQTIVQTDGQADRQTDRQNDNSQCTVRLTLFVLV